MTEFNILESIDRCKNTMLLELGEDLKVISERLGHSTITLTADTYSHVREKMQRDASDKLDKILKLNM